MHFVMKKEQIAKYVLARRRNKLQNAFCHGVVTNCETRFDTVPEQTALENREERIMPKGSPELTAARKEEIVNACEQLYQTMSFKDITLKEIGKVTSFSRTSIYNYFQTKEEIFLALFEREYDRLNEELQEVSKADETLTKKEVAERIAQTIANRQQLLKLLAMNNYDMEANSRPERLVSFKRAYGESMKNVSSILKKFCPDMSAQDIQDVVYVFFPFMFGIYPYTSVTDKQRQAMEQANVDYVNKSILEITTNCLVQLLDR